jgi:hypothetical protein
MGALQLVRYAAVGAVVGQETRLNGTLRWPPSCGSGATASAYKSVAAGYYRVGRNAFGPKLHPGWSRKSDRNVVDFYPAPARLRNVEVGSELVSSVKVRKSTFFGGGCSHHGNVNVTFTLTQESRQLDAIMH